MYVDYVINRFKYLLKCQLSYKNYIITRVYKKIKNSAWDKLSILLLTLTECTIIITTNGLDGLSDFQKPNSINYQCAQS